MNWSAGSEMLKKTREMQWMWYLGWEIQDVMKKRCARRCDEMFEEESRRDDLGIALR
jgi:hypothetical protein